MYIRVLILRARWRVMADVGVAVQITRLLRELNTKSLTLVLLCFFLKTCNIYFLFLYVLIQAAV